VAAPAGVTDPNPANDSSTDIDTPKFAPALVVSDDGSCGISAPVRVLDPVTGAEKAAFFPYEPTFKGGVRTFGYDVTGDGIQEIITAPGRSPGGVACLDAAHGRLVVGDLCVGLDPGRCGPPDGLPEENRAAWRATVSTLAARGDFDALLHGDGVPSPTGGRAALRALATTR
jgi:glyoxylase-like metal-dependent hydrolase (beta-lactamase superfamily II)